MHVAVPLKIIDFKFQDTEYEVHSTGGFLCTYGGGGAGIQDMEIEEHCPGCIHRHIR